MKKLIFISLFLMAIGGQCLAQEKHPYYCEVMGYNFWGIGRVKVLLDMGRRRPQKGLDSIYEDDLKKKKKFNTMMDVLNFMAERGWRCINTYYISEGGNQRVLHFLMEKYVANDDEAVEGLNLKEEEDKEPWKPGKSTDELY